jgi:hypothetical protein
MKQTITPNKQTVEEALSNRKYFVDFYQREYVWSKETVGILLRDIFYSFELSYDIYRNSELTPELFDKFNWYYLNIFITNTVNGKSYIVDGQQRLSTLTLIAAKLYHLVKDEDLKDALKACIYSKDKWKGSLYNIDNDKRHDVMKAVLEKTPYEQPFKNKTEETIIERYADISKYIDEKDMDEHKLKAFIMFFLEKLVLVELTIEQDDTPMIFEVINDRGESLKPFEILKGKLIGALDKNDTYSFSEIWDEAMSKLFGIEDDFFIDYLKANYITKKNSKLSTSINQAYHRYIFDSNDIANDLGFRRRDDHHISNIKNFVKVNLTYYSDLYSKIRKNPNEWLDYLNGINNFFNQYQIILAACDINDPNEVQKVEIISKEFDRMYVILRLNTAYDSNSFQEVAYSLNEALRGAQIEDYRKIFNEKIIELLKEKKSVQNPVILDYNAFLKADYTNLDQRFLRYFLARVEKYITENTNRDMINDVNYISTKTGYKTGYHIEHILSRNDENKSYFKDEDEFENKRNQLGGLLLLKGLDNLSSGNEKYDDKLKTYSAGLMWGQSLSSNFYHTNKNLEAFNKRLREEYQTEIAPIEKFDAEALEKRNQLLYKLVRIIWEID